MIALKTLLLFLILQFIVACGSGGDSAQSTENSSLSPENGDSVSIAYPSVPYNNSINAMGVDGPMAGADVLVYALQDYLDNDSSAESLLLEPSVTDSVTARADGLRLINDAGDGPFLIVVRANGSTTDLTTGAFPVISEVKTIVEEATTNRIYATPLTTLAVEMAMHEKTIAVKVVEAMGISRVGAVAHLGFGMSFDIDIFSVPPVLDETTQPIDMQVQVSEYRTATEVFATIVDQLVSDKNFADHQTAFAAIVSDALDEQIDDAAIQAAIASVNATFLHDSGRLDQTIDSLLIRENTGLSHDIGIPITFAPSPSYAEVFSLSPLSSIASSSNDFDLDGVMDSEDNCVNTPNPDQADNGGINSLVADGIGDACQCGDVNNNGKVDNTDAIILKRHVLGLPPGISGDKCNVSVGESCDNTDAILIQRAILGLPPGIAYTCSAALGIDEDADSISDAVDNCPGTANQDQSDFDGDTVGDACDSDDDNDGISDENDNFPLDSALAADPDGDGVDSGDIAGVTQDNCPLVSNSDQLDNDGDGVGDACDATPNGDNDGDGIDNAFDNCINISNADQLDSDTDGLGDVCDDTPFGVIDLDDDGVAQDVDNCPLMPNADQQDADGDGAGDVCDITPNGDSDDDGIDQLVDNCPQLSNPEQIDLDEDGLGDACDDDLQYSTLSGVATAGVLKQASVTAYAVNANGGITSNLDQSVTEDDGTFSLVIPNYQGPVIVKVEAVPGTTTMVCDISLCEPGIGFGDDYPITSLFTLSAAVPVINFGDQLVIDVTLLTTVATALLESGEAGINEDSIWSVNSMVADLFGLSTNILFDGAIDLTDTTTFTEASIDEQEAAVIASGIFAVINDQDTPLDVALNNFLGQVIGLDGQLYLNQSLVSSEEVITLFDILMAASMTLNSMDLDASESWSINSRIFSAATTALFADIGDTTQARPDPNVGSDKMLIARAFVSELRSIYNNQSLPSISDEAESSLDIFADQISATEAFVGDDINDMFDVIGRSILAVRYANINRHDASIIYRQGVEGKEIPVTVDGQTYTINANVKGFDVDLVFDFSGTDLRSDDVYRTYQSWECDFWDTYIDDGVGQWSSQQDCENGLRQFYAQNEVDRYSADINLAMTGTVTGSSLELTVDDGSRAALQGSFSEVCVGCDFPEQIQAIAEAEAMAFDLDVELRSEGAYSTPCLLFLDPLLPCGQGPGYNPTTFTVDGELLFKGQLTSGLNNAYAYLGYDDNVDDQRIEASFGLAHVGFLGELISGGRTIDMNIYAQATMNDQAIALVNESSIQQVVVSETQLQTIDYQNFQFDLYAPGLIRNDNSFLTIDVKSDFSPGHSEEFFTVFNADGSLLGLNDRYSSFLSNVDEMSLTVGNTRRLLVNIPLSLTALDRLVENDYASLLIDFSQAVNVLYGGADGTPPYASVTLTYDQRQISSELFDFDDGDVEGSFYSTTETESSFIDFDVIANFSLNLPGIETPMNLILEGRREALHDYEFAAEIAYDGRRFTMTDNDLNNSSFSISNQSGASLNLSHDFDTDGVVGNVRVGNKTMANITKVGGLVLVRYPSTGEFESIP